MSHKIMTEHIDDRNREKLIAHLGKETVNRHVCMGIMWMCIYMNTCIEIKEYEYTKGTKWCKRELPHFLKAIRCIYTSWCIDCLMI